MTSPNFFWPRSGDISPLPKADSVLPTANLWFLENLKRPIHPKNGGIPPLIITKKSANGQGMEEFLHTLAFQLHFSVDILNYSNTLDIFLQTLAI